MDVPLLYLYLVHYHYLLVTSRIYSPHCTIRTLHIDCWGLLDGSLRILTLNQRLSPPHYQMRCHETFTSYVAEVGSGRTTTIWEHQKSRG